MPDRRQQEDQLLDEIALLVDDSLSRGDQSGTWRGEGYDRCPVCSEEWHHLPITKTLREMRHGSYATDEFGQGIVDPDYRYSDDASPYICPGSSYKGPPFGDREWAWAKHQERFLERPHHFPILRPDGTPLPSNPIPLGRNRRTTRTWRFKGPFVGWNIAVDTEVEFVRSDPDFPYTGRGHNARDIPVSQTFTMTIVPDIFPVPEPSIRWWAHYQDEVESYEIRSGGQYVLMEPVKFEFTQMTVQYPPGVDMTNPDSEPAYIEITTDYPIDRHGWWMDKWELIEANNVTIDESQQHERLRHNVEDARTTSTTQEANRPHQRRSSVLHGGEEAVEERARRMAIEEQARTYEAATRPADHGSEEASNEAGGT